MTHDESLEKIYLYCMYANDPEFYGLDGYHKVIRAIAELHKPEGDGAQQCKHDKKIYPCPTIQEIEKELG